ncbi:cation:proton antiporter [Candidatus Uhrbacteria bacterium]|nr:cation:proton antiporter [Candidatus Uhrbacteria bacterium]
MQPADIFFEIGAIIVLATFLSFAASALRQPLILAYLLTGVVAGGSLLNLTRSSEIFGVLSQVGVAFLLFTVGLGLNWRGMRQIGRAVLLVGIGQITLATLAGFFLGRVLGFETISALIVGLGFALSSTIIIVKILADKDELDTLHGRLTVGVLLVQDLVAMVALLALAALGTDRTFGDILAIAFTKGFLAVVVLAAFGVWLLPPIVRYAARSQELLLLFAIGWCFAAASALQLAGFSMGIGALLAGIALSGTAFQREILARVRNLRDFFLIIFFIVLGTNLDLSAMPGILPYILAFSLLVLILNPVVVLLLTRILGFHPRTGWLTGSTLAQVSEFSFILVGLAAAQGLVESSLLSLTAAVGFLTITISSYLIKYSDLLYRFVRPATRFLEPHAKLRHEVAQNTPEIFLFGCHRTGETILPAVQALKKSFTVVDFHPEAVERLRERGIHALYGDVGDEDLLEDIRAHKARLIISTVQDMGDTTTILEYLAARKFKGNVIVTVKYPAQAEVAYAAGADYVIVPTVLGGQKFAELLSRAKLSTAHWRRLIPPPAKGGVDSKPTLV